jgi:FKBP-type peptidyl-prolyl cis-trans isomerase
MKRYWIITLALAGICRLQAADTAAEQFKDPKDKISYALGVNFGNNLRQQGVEVNLDEVVKGIKDGRADKPLLDEKEMRATFMQLRTQIQAHMKDLEKENKAAGEKFLAENATKEGVVKLPDGLQYKVIQEGSGPTPGTNDTVSVKYTGKLINGEVFDSTDRRGGEPVKFRVTGVIRGWTEALLKMKKGAVWDLVVPSDLAYGDNGRPGIPPASTLLFHVELVDFEPPAAPPQLRPSAAHQPVTSDIIKVPSAEELKKGAKIEVIKPQDLDKEIAKEKARKEAAEKK